jgi:hypothetical protein
VDAVAAADAGCKLVFARLLRDRLANGLYVLDQDIGALRDLNSEAGVTDVAAGQTKVQPPAGLVIDLLSDGSGESDDVVIQRLFQFLLPRNETRQIRHPFLRTFFQTNVIGLWNDLGFGKRLRGEQFDLQPDAQLVFVGPDGPHFGT